MKHHVYRRSMRFFLLALVIVAGCTSRNGRYCGDGICTDPEHPFCDIDGAIAGAANTCIAVSCTPGDFKMCRGNDALICSADGNDFDDKACQNGCDPIHGCVGCTDSSQCANPTPTCDTGSHECRACTADADCASNVCDTDSGACIAESTIAYASPSGSDSASCTKADPCSFAHASAITNLTVNTVKLAPGVYSAALTIIGKALTVYGDGATLRNTAASSIEVDDHSHVRIVGLSITNDSSVGFALRCRMNDHVNMPIVELVNAHIEAAFTGAMGVDCMLTIDRSQLHSSYTQSGGFVVVGIGTTTIQRSIVSGGDGVASLGGTMEVVNSVIADPLGPDGALTSKAQLLGEGQLYVRFSTIANAQVFCQPSSVFCGEGAACVENSIIVNGAPGAPADTVSGNTCTFAYSIVYPQTTAIAGGTNKSGVNPVLFDAAHGDYHLQSSSPAIDAADPAATLSIDFDGRARPQGPRDDMGAFEYKP